MNFESACGSSSMLTPMTVTPWDRISVANCSRLGASMMQGGHHVAQKFSKTTCPLNCDSDNLPDGVCGRVNPGARSPRLTGRCSCGRSASHSTPTAAAATTIHLATVTLRIIQTSIIIAWLSEGARFDVAAALCRQVVILLRRWLLRLDRWRDKLAATTS